MIVKKNIQRPTNRGHGTGMVPKTLALLPLCIAKLIAWMAIVVLMLIFISF